MIQEVSIDIGHRIGKRVVVSKFDIHKYEDHVMNQMVYDFTACFAGEYQDPWIFREPASWWQHFKKECFPKWLKGWFPVKETDTKLSITLLYPHLKTKLPLGMIGHNMTILVKSQQGACRFMNADPLSPLTPVEQFDKAIDHKFYSPEDKRCPVCRKLINYPG